MMQKQARLPEIFDKFPRIPILDLTTSLPPLPEMKSWPDLGTLNFDYPRINLPPPHLPEWKIEIGQDVCGD